MMETVAQTGVSGNPQGVSGNPQGVDRASQEMVENVAQNKASEKYYFSLGNDIFQKAISFWKN